MPRFDNHTMLDKDIRSVLIDHFLSHDPSAAVHHELRLSRGRGRADCAIVNGTLSGYEIKSTRDSLARLSGQVPNYEKVFEFCSVVVAKKHLKRIKDAVPRRWGIILAECAPGGDAILQDIRQPQRNPNTDKQALVRLLWKQEVVDALRNNHIAYQRNAVARDLWALLETLPKNTIMEEVRVALKAR